MTNLIPKKNVIFGFENDPSSKYFSPTLVDKVDWEMDIMQEEIFGPILPILEFQKIQDVYDLISSKPTPLAAYFFQNEKPHRIILSILLILVVAVLMMFSFTWETLTCPLEE